MLRLDFRASRLELTGLAVCHLLAQLSILQLDTSWLTLLVLSATLTGNCGYLVLRACHRLGDSVLVLELADQGRATLQTRAGLVEGQIIALPYISGWLTVLRVQINEPGREPRRTRFFSQARSSRCFTIRVLPDTLPRGQRRQLAAFLKFYRLPPG